jgi:septal ring factor EnvC (AmiA/AmiB activator)
MTDQQFYLAVGIPSAFFALYFLALLAGFFWQSKRFEDMRSVMQAEIASVRSEIGGVRAEVGGVRAEIGSVRAEIGSVRAEIARVESTLRSELQRVEGVLSAKLDGLSARVKVLEDEGRRPLVTQ